ncbi:MAG: hypothetical protein A3F90_16940 [Deltaproteobacteria bacterium RIFCSPLOWO2_12_FULL_60_19]|nr:MAG: hypothetical protein A3F90_16940 [Deltaproteobacteria bacterium RIFCSPLOWO2_12_FULL_60_19]
MNPRNSTNPIDDPVKGYATSRGFHKRTLDRWLALKEADAAALLALVQELKVGENHLKDFLDWLEEIALRDGVSVAAILARDEMSRVVSDPRLGRNDKLKRLKDELRRLRFPRLAKIEEEIQRRVRAMKLDPGLSVNVPAGLEGGAVILKIQATSYDEARRLTARLGDVMERAEMKEIFSLLHGDGTEW